MMTLAGALRQFEAQLRAGPHPDRARLDAEALLLHATGKNLAWLLAHGDDEFGGCTAMRAAALIERRIHGEPIQYITGECEFYGLPFRVTPAVLIPRPETEHLVEKALEFAQHFPTPRIADIGTGSGAIAVAVAHTLPHARITATDLSDAALAIARENAERNRVSGRIRFLKADLLGLPSSQPADAAFDLIVSNPPYIPTTDRASLSVEVRNHEPELALFAGPDGLSIYRRLIPAAHARLTDGGYLALEIGYAQSEPIAQLLHQSNFRDIAFTPDLQGIPRVAHARK